MKIKVNKIEDSKKYENCRKVGVKVYRQDIDFNFFIDRHIPIVDGETDEYYVDNVMEAKGRNGKTMKEEIEEFSNFVPAPLPEPEPEEELEISPLVGTVLQI